MDFTRDETETEVSALAAQVLGTTRGETPPHPSAAGAADFDHAAWRELGRAGLLSLALPADLGGEGLGVQATAAVLAEVGRNAARLPALATLACGVLPVIRSADAALRGHLLAGVASGDTILTAAIREPSDPMPSVPGTVVSPAGTVTGVKTGVCYAAAARWILVPASSAAGPVVTVVEPDADGLSCQRTRSSSGLPEYTQRLDETPVLHVLDGCTV